MGRFIIEIANFKLCALTVIVFCNIIYCIGKVYRCSALIRQRIRHFGIVLPLILRICCSITIIIRISCIIFCICNRICGSCIAICPGRRTCTTVVIDIILRIRMDWRCVILRHCATHRYAVIRAIILCKLCLYTNIQTFPGHNLICIGVFGILGFFTVTKGNCKSLIVCVGCF